MLPLSSLPLACMSVRGLRNRETAVPAPLILPDVRQPSVRLSLIDAEDPRDPSQLREWQQESLGNRRRSSFFSFSLVGNRRPSSQQLQVSNPSPPPLSLHPLDSTSDEERLPAGASACDPRVLLFSFPPTALLKDAAFLSLSLSQRLSVMSRQRQNCLGCSLQVPCLPFDRRSEGELLLQLLPTASCERTV